LFTRYAADPSLVHAVRRPGANRKELFANSCVQFYLVRMDLTTITPSPAGLKALSHPVRLKILGLLRSEGPATATTLAATLGLNTGATSYHLRQLAQHGFVVDDAARGNGRDRWWQAAHQATTTEADPHPDRETRETLDAYLQSVAVIHTEQLQGAIEERSVLSDEWRGASTFSDWNLRLTPRRAHALVEALARVLTETDEDEDGDEDAAEFVVQVSAFPRPGVVGAEAAPTAAGDEP
jgi:predicted ArsR family transcriptional regulator